VAGFVATPAGFVPRIQTRISATDRLQTWCVRLGIGRDHYHIAPGLYCVGQPDNQSPVLVTANYKLTFDALRRSLDGLDAWILVLDTRGVNVWCAAGKGTLSTTEVLRMVSQTRLADIVAHRTLILPQLAATGVNGLKVRKQSGFAVVWGPIQAAHIRQFLAAGMQADESMRRVTFALGQRLVLVPVEIFLLKKALAWTLLATFILSGIGPEIFSLHNAWHRGATAAAAVVCGILAGVLLVPALLPWIPGRAFFVKGAAAGLVSGIAWRFIFLSGPTGLETLALIGISTVAGSFLAMNFTGSTPFTSPTGVEKEMRQAIPLQLAALLLAVMMWIAAPFTG
jgi:hypothetical protein